jgi:hypothetical protein
MKRKILSLLLSALLLIGAAGCASSGGKKQTAEGIATQKTEAEAAAETEATTAEEKLKMSYENTDTSFNYYTNTIGNVEYYGIVEITNTGSTNIYLKDCTFDLEDNDGHLLQSASFISSCPDIIAPGEKGYFYNSIGSTQLDKEVSTDNGLNLVPQFKLEEGKGDIVDYEVSDTSLRKDDFGYAKVTGRITNTTDEDINLLYVQVIFKDTAGKVLSITGTNVMDISAGSTGSFEAGTFGNSSVDFDSIAEFEVIARKTHYQF